MLAFGAVFTPKSIIDRGRALVLKSNIFTVN